MCHQQAKRPIKRQSRYAILVGMLFIVLVFVLSACGSATFEDGTALAAQAANQSSNQASNQEAYLTSNQVAQQNTATGQSTYEVKVFFSKAPQSLNDPTAVFPVARVSTTIAVGSFAVQLLIAGPTLGEREIGYF